MTEWLSGYGHTRPPIIRHQAAAEAAQDRALATVWLKGQRRRMVEIICCPECGSPATLRDNRTSEEYQRWECVSPTCQHAWKEPRSIMVARAISPESGKVQKLHRK